MAHDFYIGTPVTREVDTLDGVALQPRVDPISTPTGEEPIHSDPHEIQSDAGSGERTPSFRTWNGVLETLPRFEQMWLDIREYATERHEPSYIPVAIYQDHLNEVEDEALSVLESGTQDEECAAHRALWFVRWSRYAYEQHGGRAVFQSGEPLSFR